MYNDTKIEALKNITKSDEDRKKYYSLVSNQIWSDRSNYDLYLDASMDEEALVDTIVSWAKKLNFH